MKNYGLELIKIIAIFFVICSHVSPYYMQKLPDNFGMYLLSETGMLGVILFFSVSGFFILNNQRIDQFSYIFQKIKNTSRIFIIWVIIYFLFGKYIVSTATQIKQVSLWRYLDVLSCFSEASPPLVSSRYYWPLYSGTANSTCVYRIASQYHRKKPGINFNYC